MPRPGAPRDACGGAAPACGRRPRPRAPRVSHSALRPTLASLLACQHTSSLWGRRVRGRRTRTPQSGRPPQLAPPCSPAPPPWQAPPPGPPLEQRPSTSQSAGCKTVGATGPQRHAGCSARVPAGKTRALCTRQGAIRGCVRWCGPPRLVRWTKQRATPPGRTVRRLVRAPRGRGGGGRSCAREAPVARAAADKTGAWRGGWWAAGRPGACGTAAAGRDTAGGAGGTTRAPTGRARAACTRVRQRHWGGVGGGASGLRPGSGGPSQASARQRKGSAAAQSGALGKTRCAHGARGGRAGRGAHGKWGGRAPLPALIHSHRAGARGRTAGHTNNRGGPARREGQG